MSIAVRKCHEGVCKVHSSKLEVQNSKEMHWRPWVPAIGRNKERMGGGVPLGTEYWLGWLSVVGWTRILGLAGWMQARFEICRGLTFGTYQYKFMGNCAWRPEALKYFERSTASPDWFNKCSLDVVSGCLDGISGTVDLYSGSKESNYWGLDGCPGCLDGVSGTVDYNVGLKESKFWRVECPDEGWKGFCGLPEYYAGLKKYK